MFGSGCGMIGTILTKVRHPMVVHGRMTAMGAKSCAAVPGTVNQSTFAPPTATGSPQRSETTQSGSEYRGRLPLDPLPLYPLFVCFGGVQRGLAPFGGVWGWPQRSARRASWPTPLANAEPPTSADPRRAPKSAPAPFVAPPSGRTPPNRPRPDDAAASRLTRDESSASSNRPRQ